MSGVVDGQIESKRQRRRDDLLRRGLCRRCRNPRGKDGTEVYCRPCASLMSISEGSKRKRRLAAGLCEMCCKPRGDNGTKTMCRSCADADAANQRERRQRLMAEELCVVCGGERGDGGTKSMCRRHADEVNARHLKRIERLIAEGRCISCRRVRGDDGTEERCRSCADKRAARTRRRYQQLTGEGFCVVCGGARGDDGTKSMCRRCADADAAYDRERYQRLIEDGVCPEHREPLRILERCPACLYETSNVSATSVSFEGLLPPPTSGDRLEVCVGCLNCGGVYHKGHLYYLTRLRPGFKLRDEHVGEDGAGLWLRFSREDERGLVPIEYEACSMPDEICTEFAPKRRALDFLRRYRTGARLSGACKVHLQDRERLRKAAAAQAQNGGKQKNLDADKKQWGGARNVKWSRDSRARLLTTYKDVLPKVQNLDPSLPEDVKREASLRGNKPSEVALSYAARLIGIEPTSYLETVLTKAKEEAESAQYSNRL